MPAALAADAVLIASELLGNAYLHARSAAGLSVSWQAGTLRVEVADDSAALPGRVDACRLGRHVGARHADHRCSGG